MREDWYKRLYFTKSIADNLYEIWTGLLIFGCSTVRAGTPYL